MCRHLETRIDSVVGQAGQDTGPQVEESLRDIAEGLELSRKLLILAEGPWKECGHKNYPQLQGILREAAQSIVTETRRFRMELEASGRVHFGCVAVEESAGSDGPEPLAPRWGGPPRPARTLEVVVGPVFAGMYPAVQPTSTAPSSPGAPGRFADAIWARLMPGRLRQAAVEPRQGGT
jgi:hypothetical protein